MRLSPRLIPVAAALLLGGVLSAGSTAAAARPGDDAVVVAVIDSGFSPYHWDYLAAHMPQAKTATKGDDLPLTKAPHTWLRGFPKPSAFASYEPLRLSLDAKNPNASQAKLHERDADAWGEVEASFAGDVSYRWIPGTKVVGAISFGGASGSPVYGTGDGEHGMGSASVSVGNIHGTCPECLLVFIQAGDYETALEWAEEQPWIDAVTNSYGHSSSILLRDRVYAGSDVDAQRAAIERGQSVFFSAGNGLINDFVTPNGTLLSSQEGPDWIVTVGATDPTNNNYPGAGKPADIAGIGTMYPSAYNSGRVNGEGNFGGTSNATPTIAGTYARALWMSRVALSGPSRIQQDGLVATGGRYACAAKRRSCELGDGRLTRVELQRRLFEGALPSTGGFAGRRSIHSTVIVVPVPPPVGGYPIPFVTTPAVADSRRFSEGYGTYRGRIDGNDKWQAEFNGRLWTVLTGQRPAPGRPAGDTEWFRVDSWCRQHIWGEWAYGDFRDSASTPLPAPDPATPSRNAYHAICQGLRAPPS